MKTNVENVTAERVAGYDLIRSLAILSVFVYHVVNRQLPNSASSIIASAAASISLALLGFISAALLTRQLQEYGTFLLRRLGRIYIPMVLCLGFVIILRWIMDLEIGGQHALMHVMGFTAFFKLLGTASKAPIGYGLWFVTIIVILYLLMPALRQLFRHRNHRWHVIGSVGLITLLNHIMWGTENIGNVCTAFVLGLYVNEAYGHDRLEEHVRARPVVLGVVALGLVFFGAVIVRLGIPKAGAQLFFALTPLAIVPVILVAAGKLPRSLVSASGFFAALSFEFYILHFYFINDELNAWFPWASGLGMYLVVPFVITIAVSYVMARLASRLRWSFDDYLRAGRAG